MKPPGQDIIANDMPKFDLWAKQLNEHLAALDAPGALSDADNERIFFQTNDLLIDIARNFFSYGKFKDKWDTSKCSHHLFGQHLYLRSEKMDLEFYWGLDNQGFYIESDLLYGENLRYMTDDFWQLLLDLKLLGNFELRGNGGLNPEERNFFENKTSIVFQLIRKFMLSQMAAMNNKDNCQQHSLDIGTVTLRWDFDTGWADLLASSCQAFKILYKLNYQLWKISGLAKKAEPRI